MAVMIQVPTPDEPRSTATEALSPVRLWLRLLSCTMLIERRLAGSLRTRFGTTLARFDLLAQLAHARDGDQDGLTMSDLSRRLMVSNGNITGLVARLAREGLIKRRRSPRDGRAQLVCLTPKGEQALAEMIPEHHAWLAELFEGMPPEERDRLYALVGVLKGAVERASRGGAA